MKTILISSVFLIYTFITQLVYASCPIVTAPFQENFDNPYWNFIPATIDSCWTNILPQINAYEWRTKSGQTNSFATGPNGGLTGNGQYLYTEASLGNMGDTAILESPLIDISALTAPQIEFYYHMNGPTIGTLQIHLWTNGTWSNIWSLSGPQQSSVTDPWSFVNVSIPVSDSIKFRLVGIRGASFTGDIAIDDIRIRNTPSNDVRLTNVSGLQSGCELDSNTSFNIEVYNLGLNNIDSFLIQHSVNGGTFISNPSGLIGINPSQRQSLTVNGIDLSGGGLKCIDVKLTMPGDEDSLNNSLAQFCLTNFNNPTIDSIKNGEVCIQGQVELKVISLADSIYWYNDSALTSLFHQGPSYSAFFNQAKTYYVQVTDSNNCLSPVHSVSVQISQVPTVAFSIQVDNCEVDFTANVSANTDSVFWDFGDSIGTSGNLNPTYTYSSSQSYLVNLKAFAGSCFSDTTEVLYVNCISGIDSQLDEDLKIYPNPASNQFTITRQWSSIPSLKLFDSNGKEIELQVVQDGNDLYINTEELSRGMYFLKILDKGEIYSNKVFIE